MGQAIGAPRRWVLVVAAGLLLVVGLQTAVAYDREVLVVAHRGGPAPAAHRVRDLPNLAPGAVAETTPAEPVDAPPVDAPPVDAPPVDAVVASAPQATQPVPDPGPAAQPAPVPAPVSDVPHHLVVGAAALAQLRHVDISGLGWQVEFHPGRAGFLGIADAERKVVDVWIRPDHDVTDVIGTLAHEFGHVLDHETWTPAMRDEWLRLRGMDATWWPGCTCDDRDYGAGDMAEALVILEAGPGEWTGRNGMPTTAQLDWLLAQL